MARHVLRIEVMIADKDQEALGNKSRKLFARKMIYQAAKSGSLLVFFVYELFVAFIAKLGYFYMLCDMLYETIVG